jgi:hypothetical protein
MDAVSPFVDARGQADRMCGYCAYNLRAATCPASEQKLMDGGRARGNATD